ncbi:MAG TPA: RHS repeat domain-containing protein, partial [Thermoanaerobaculia bacterium]
MSRRGPLPLLALAAILSIAPALADVHPNTAPGLPVDQSFHVGDIDSVNLFNGALTLTIPIGASYPVNSFSYALKLTYNSSPWEFLTVSRVDPHSQLDVTRTQAIPNRCSNAGLGWRVSFGRMNPPCQVPDMNGSLSNRPIYQDENGTDHIFYGTLHDGDAEDALVAGVSDTEYTRDGSYLRLKFYTAGYNEIEYPDGSVRRFDAMTGMPTELRDRFSNKLAISYPPMEPFEGQFYPAWKLTDTQGRTQEIYFRTDLPPYAQTIHAIALTSFGGTPAIYRFNYTSPTIGLPCPNNDSDTMDGNGTTVMAPLLTSVTLPDNSSWTANSYITALPSGPTWPGNACTDNAGNLTTLTLPTLGSLSWTWQKVYFPSGSAQKPHLQTNPGVATRTMLDPNHSAQNGTWTYTYAPGFPAADGSKEHTTTIIDPLGHRTVNYFSVALDASYTGCSTYDYSLPFSCLRPLGGSALNLSRQTFNGASDSSLLRSEYVDYERDPVFAVIAPDWYNTNRRPLQTRTVYEDDPGIYGGMINSNFDGLGHYRSQKTEGSFPSANDRIHFANFNPAQGTYTVDQVHNMGSGFTLFSPASPWVLEAPSSMSDTEGGATSQVDLCYVPGTAAVTRKRVHRQDGAATSAQDLISVYDIVAGNVTAEKSYGGDASGRGVGVTDVCNLSLPAPEIEIDHTYAAGVRSSSKYAGTGFYFLSYLTPSTGFPAIDPSTGLPVSSFDTAGLATDYEFDVFGRLLWSKPRSTGQGGWTEYVYTSASGSIQPNVRVRRRANGSKSAPILAVNQIVFDGFGRVFQEQKTLPDNMTAKRETVYDTAGNKKSVSEWTTGSATNLTQYFSYDPFGRPGTIQPPDGAAHSVTLTYHGVRQVDRTVKIATAPGSENPAKTTEVYDRQGRLSSVTEPSGTGGANVTTTYGYDVGNRLATVSTTGSGVTQSRAFAYDNRGLLNWEKHPEKGAAGNGTVSYLGYDARGHAHRKIDGPNDLSLTYDGA